MTQATSANKTDVVYARFVYDPASNDSLTYRYTDIPEGNDDETVEAIQFRVPSRDTYTPRDVSAIFHQIDLLLVLARKITEANVEREPTHGMMYINTTAFGRAEAPPKPLEVRRISLNSPLETIVALAAP